MHKQIDSRSVIIFVTTFLLGLCTGSANTQVQNSSNSDFPVFPWVERAGITRLNLNSYGRSINRRMNAMPSDWCWLNNQEVRKQLRLTRKQSEQLLKALEQMNDLVKKTVEDKSERSRDELAEFHKWSNERLPRLLDETQRETLNEFKLAYIVKTSRHDNPGVVKQAKKLLTNNEFWERIEAPSRQARKKAIQSILDCLTKDQIDKLKQSLLDDSILYSSHSPNDILHFQLTYNHKRQKSKIDDDSNFVDFLFLGDHVVNVDGSINYQYFALEDSRVPVMVKLKMFMDRNFQERLELADFQITAVSDAARELNKARNEIHKRSQEEGGNRRVLDSNEMKEAEELAGQKLDNILLDHQAKAIELEISSQLLPKMGLVWSLTEGNLAKQIEVTERQKEDIKKAAQNSAKKLKQTSKEILDVFRSRFPDEIRFENEVDISKFRLSEKVCAAPDSLIPPSACTDERGVKVSLFQLKTNNAQKANQKEH